MKFQEELSHFFQNSKRKIRNSDITICMGNEACDIDSFLSSLVVAMHEKCIHVVNMKREILEAKGDVMYILNYFKISLDDLVYLERPVGEFSLEARKLGTKFICEGEEYKLSDKNIKLMIVDHNKPILELSDAKIDLIIDHHHLSGTAMKARRVYVDIDIGSCSTLVSKFIGHSLTSSKNNKNPEFISEFFCEHIAKLLLVPIFLDTKKLSTIASHFDKGEFKKLKKKSKLKMKEIRKIRKEIKKARLNDSKLSNDLIMQKDFKVYHHRGLNFGCATVKYNFEKWADREMGEYGKKNSKNGGVFLESFFNQFRRNQGLDFLFINRKSGKFRYFIVSNCLFERILASENNFKQVDYKGLKYYSINVALSRKVLMPIVESTLDRLNLLIPDGLPEKSENISGSENISRSDIVSRKSDIDLKLLKEFIEK